MLEIAALLPDPEGDDAEEEWIEVRNPGSEAVPADGWKIADKSGKSFVLKGYFAPGETKRLSVKETKVSLNNKDEEIALIDPNGTVVGRLRYAKAGEGEIIAAKEVIEGAGSDVQARLPAAQEAVLPAPSPYEAHTRIVGSQSFADAALIGILGALCLGYAAARMTETIYAEENTRKSGRKKQ